MLHVKKSTKLPILAGVLLIIAVVLSACSSQGNVAQTSPTAGQAQTARFKRKRHQQRRPPENIQTLKNVK